MNSSKKSKSSKQSAHSDHVPRVLKSFEAIGQKHPEIHQYKSKDTHLPDFRETLLEYEQPPVHHVHHHHTHEFEKGHVGHHYTPHHPPSAEYSAEPLIIQDQNPSSAIVPTVGDKDDTQVQPTGRCECLRNKKVGIWTFALIFVGVVLLAALLGGAIYTIYLHFADDNENST